MLRNKLVLASLGLGMLLVAARASFADTITVHDLSQNTTTGVFTYAVQLDNAADVHAGDGFVIYDFPGLISATFSGGLTSSQFVMTQSLTSNSLNKASSVDANGFVAAISNSEPGFDSASVENISFAYVGPPTVFLGATMATLTLTSSVHGGETDSVYGSVDHSGPNGNVPFSFSANPVTVPSASVPLPASWLGSAALFSLMGVARAKKLLVA